MADQILYCFITTNFQVNQGLCLSTNVEINTLEWCKNVPAAMKHRSSHPKIYSDYIKVKCLEQHLFYGIVSVWICSAEGNEKHF